MQLLCHPHGILQSKEVSRETMILFMVRLESTPCKLVFNKRMKNKPANCRQGTPFHLGRVFFLMYNGDLREVNHGNGCGQIAIFDLFLAYFNFVKKFRLSLCMQ